MTEQEFQRLLLQSESATLDFKEQQYNFSNDSDNRKTAEFVKDIISFSNTIRRENAYIIIGVKVRSDGQKELLGINENIDDSIFQEKLKSKVFPIPYFSYETFNFKDKVFGIIEIPIRKYTQPIHSVIKLKGLEPGKFYFRRGSSNSEANGLESINIANWLHSLPEVSFKGELLELISEIISRVNNTNIKLSDCISEAFRLATKFNLEKLRLFCENEISGKFVSEQIESEYSYRINEVALTLGKLNIPSYLNWDSRRMMNELKKMEGFDVIKYFFHESILEIETILEELSKNNSTLWSIKLPAITIIDDEKYKDLYATLYTNKDTFDILYKNIRQELIANLLFLMKE